MTTKNITLAIMLILAGISNANATMPMLTDTPNSPTLSACRDWASKQDEDALDMWGIQEDGKSSSKVAIRRLTDSCMGKPKPAIVGFGSSVGFDRMFCKKHPKLKQLCRDDK